MTRRDLELSALLEIKDMLAKKKKLQQEINAAEKMKEQIGEKIKSTKYDELPTDNAKKLEDSIFHRAILIEDVVKVILGIVWGVAALVFVAILLWKVSVVGINNSLPYLIASVILVCLSVAGAFMDWNSTFLGFVGLGAIVTAGIFFARVGWIYLGIFVVGCAVAAGSFVINSNLPYDDLLMRKKLDALWQAKKEDEENQKENNRRYHQACENMQKNMQEYINAENVKINQCKSDIRLIDKKIVEMNIICVEDIVNIDYIISRISSHRADSVKEALQQLDDQLDKQEREKREISRRNAERFLAEQRWLREQEKQERDRQNWENEERWRQNREYERREEHRKNVEDELREIRKQLED